MHRKHVPALVGQLTRELSETDSFRNDAALVASIGERCNKALCFSIGHAGKLARFAEDCHDMLLDGRAFDDELDELRARNKYLLALTVFIDQYDLFEDGASWSDRERNQWAEACVKALRQPPEKPKSP